MKALSIKQPWAWAIIRPDITDAAQRIAAYLDGKIKDIENRTWAPPQVIRGRILIHAAKTFDDVNRHDFERFFGVKLPDRFDTGGIIGEATLSCVMQQAGAKISPQDTAAHYAAELEKWRTSPWAGTGAVWFCLRDATPLPFRPLRGMLGFFDA